VIRRYTQPAGEQKHMGALLVGVNENGKLKFAGRVGTGFTQNLLKALSLELNKIAVKSCPFFNLPATGYGLHPGLTRDDRLPQPVFLRLREDKSANAVVREKGALIERQNIAQGSRQNL
jgi:bifunctional non-homologous end joining protein LigD